MPTNVSSVICLHQWDALNSTIFSISYCDSVLITTVCHRFLLNIHSKWYAMRLQSICSTSWSFCMEVPPSGMVEQHAERRTKGTQALPDTPAPYMHLIHSYLIPVTCWPQNGIDYWFPSCHRSVVIAGFSGLAEGIMLDSMRCGGQQGETHKQWSTNTHFY